MWGGGDLEPQGADWLRSLSPSSMTFWVSKTHSEDPSR
jgi:hypothetical protein